MHDELKLLIAAKLDVIDFLDIVGYDLSDLLELMEDEIENYRQELMDACS